MPVSPAAGIPPADILSQKPPIPPGEKRLVDFIKIPAEQLFSGISQILFLASKGNVLEREGGQPFFI